MTPALRLLRPRSMASTALTAVLSLGLALSFLSTTPPAAAAATTSTKAAVCSASLRTSATTSATRRTSVSAGTKVTVTGTVTGGGWKVNCGGKTVFGKSWYRISAINGKSVKSLYGVSYLYSATGLYKSATVTRYAACSANLRTKAYASAARKTKIATGTKVTVTATVSGGSWSTTCSGKSVAGKTWHRISAINGKSVKSLYGVTYLYAASGLFASSPPKSTTTTTKPSPTPSPTPTPTPTPKPAQAWTEGIDVSHWQGTIDWSKVAAAGKKFVYLKASQHTTFVDKRYATNRAGANAAGLVVGAYHYANPDSTPGDAVAEADHFIATAAFKSGDLIPVLDLEETGDLSLAGLQQWTKDFLGRIHQRTGVKAAIYVSPSFWNNKMGNTTWFAKNGYEVLWIAHWTSGSTPTMTASNWGGHGWTFWQYSATGSVPGISGNVDLDRFNGTDLTRVLIP